jgi:hypothetical protein
MREARDLGAAAEFVRRCLSISEFAHKGKQSGIAEEHLRNLLRLAFLQGWHEAMVARDNDDERSREENSDARQPL